MERESAFKFIDIVQFLIELCILNYMTRKEAVNKIQNDANIGPQYTEIVWQRLEEQNSEFFKFYYTRLALNQQVDEFNKLLVKQKQLTDEEKTKIASLPTSIRFHYHGGSSFGMVDMFAPIPPDIPNSNGESSFGMLDGSIRPYSHNSNLDLQQAEIDGGMTNSVPECSNSSPYMFGSDGKISEVSPNVDNVSVTPFTIAKSILHSMSEPVKDCPYTYLDESISRKFSFSNMSDYPFYDFSMDFDPL